METSHVLCSGLVERIGSQTGKLTYKKSPGTEQQSIFEEEKSFPCHTDGITRVIELLLDPEYGVITTLNEISACGHRGVMGAEKFTKPTIVTSEMLATLESLSLLAPLHNPPTIQGMKIMSKMLPCPSVAVFDTEFHATMPEYAYKYAIPNEMYESFGIRRYGFHGTSHRYVSEQAASLLNRSPQETNVITCHLGNGSSIAAVHNGQCIDTTMGLTPLSGVVMGTRCGDIDPAIYPLLARQNGSSIEEIDTMLNSASGLTGICGMNDMRDIHAAIEKGDSKAALALDMFCYSIRKYIGAFYVALEKVDAVVFTGGIGENDDIARAAICRGLQSLGVHIDLQKNAVRSDKSRSLSLPDSPVDVLVIPTNEELAIATATVQALQAH